LRFHPAALFLAIKPLRDKTGRIPEPGVLLEAGVRGQKSAVGKKENVRN